MHFTNHFPVVSLRSTTGYCLKSLRDKKLRNSKGSTTRVFYQSCPGRRCATFRRYALPWAMMWLPHSGHSGRRMRRKADGMTMPPSLTRGIFTTSLEWSAFHSGPPRWRQQLAATFITNANAWALRRFLTGGSNVSPRQTRLPPR
jgi:hypothetical protein